MLETYTSLLITKLYVPRERSSHVLRNHLLTTLNAGLERKLILIAAAGFGKTALLADWSRQHTGNIAWLSLDESDNDPTRFLSYVIGALQTCRPSLGRELLAALQSPTPSPPSFENALQSLINQIAAINGRLTLIIDDYHVIENQLIHAGLSFLLDHLPPEMTIVLLTHLTEMPHNLLTIETLALLALARQSHGDSVHALLALEQALPLAEAENRVRTFLDLGSPMAKLLAHFCETHPDNIYARKLLSTFPAEPQAAQSIDPLSERELDVLRLIVAGYSNEEIAQSLTLAISTIKWYVNTLYGKLHVKSRSQAIARTHELKLLLH